MVGKCCQITGKIQLKQRIKLPGRCAVYILEREKRTRRLDEEEMKKANRITWRLAKTGVKGKGL